MNFGRNVFKFTSFALRQAILDYLQFSSHESSLLDER